MDLPLRRRLITADQPISHVYFLDRGYTSIVNNSEGGRVELEMIGREGMVGVPVAIKVSRNPFEYFIQSAATAFAWPRLTRRRPSTHAPPSIASSCAKLTL
jgi:hypothetical protein